MHFWSPWPVPGKDWGLTSVSACVTVSAYLWTLVIDDPGLSLDPGNQTRHVLAHYQPGPDWDKNWGLNVDCVLCWHKLLLAAALSTRPPPHQPGRSDSWFIRMMVSRLSGSLSRECTAAAACTNTIHPTEETLCQLLCHLIYCALTLTLDNVHDEFMTMQTVHIFIVSYRNWFSSASQDNAIRLISALFIPRPCVSCVTCHTGCPVSGHCEARAPQTQWHWALVTRQTEWGSDSQRQWEGTLHHFPDCLALWGQTQLDDSHSYTTWMFYGVIERR